MYNKLRRPSFFNNVIKKHPEYSDAYFIRAGLLVYIGNEDYQKILSDIDNAIRCFSSNNYKSAFDSTASMYSLRAKVDILSSNYQQAIDDLFTAVKIDPDKINNVFNTGGVKPEDESNPSAIQISDLNKLISMYPNDYKTYLFRGLFYSVFSTYGGEQYFTLAISDLEQSLRINPNSALTNYFLGSIYVSMTFWTKAAASDVSDSTGQGGGYRDKTNETALNYFKEAIKFDDRFVNAYSQIAESLFSLKRYSEAIPYYDKVIELNPNNASAYNDRGLAKTNTNDFYGAISDFSDSIKLKQSKPDSMLDNTYKNRADAYMKISDYGSAIDDYSRAIGLKFAQLVYLMSIPQIRAIYPEFNDISDGNLLEGFHKKYFSNMASSDFLGNYANNKKPYEDNIIADLYVNRGDAYWAQENFRKACQEYLRAINEDSSYGLPRWKVITKDAGSESSIDLQTLDFSKNGFVSLWIKTAKAADQSSDKINGSSDFVVQEKQRFIDATRSLKT